MMSPPGRHSSLSTLTRSPATWMSWPSKPSAASSLNSCGLPAPSWRVRVPRLSWPTFLPSSYSIRFARISLRCQASPNELENLPMARSLSHCQQFAPVFSALGSCDHVRVGRQPAVVVLDRDLVDEGAFELGVVPAPHQLEVRHGAPVGGPIGDLERVAATGDAVGIEVGRPRRAVPDREHVLAADVEVCLAQRVVGARLDHRLDVTLDVMGQVLVVVAEEHDVLAASELRTDEPRPGPDRKSVV